jgi:predicted RND superfamily exporter protein
VKVNRIFNFILSNRLLCMTAVLLAVITAGSVLPSLKTNNLIDTFLARNDPGLVFYRETVDRFGGDHIILVAVEVSAGTIYTKSVFQVLDRLSQELEMVDGVYKVKSLANVDAFRHVDEDIHIDKLVETPPESAEDFTEIRETVRDSPLILSLVAPKERSTLIVVELDETLIRNPERQSEIVKNVRTICMEEETEAIRFHLAGNPVIGEAIEVKNVRDQRIFSSLMLLLVGLFSYWFLRRLSAAFMPLLVVIVSTVCTMGIFTWAGLQTNWVTSIIIPILFLVSVADSIHVLERYYMELPRSESKREAILKTMRELAYPCFLTSLTTACGFGSLVTNQVQPVRQFGIFAAIGVILALIVTFICLPCLLSLGRGKAEARRKAEDQREAGDRSPSGESRSQANAETPPVQETRKKWETRFFLWLDRFVQRRRWAIFIVSLLLLVPIGIGIHRIRVETNLLKYFKEDDILVKDADYIERAYGGSSPLDIIIDTGRKYGAVEPDLLRSISDLQDFLEATPGVYRGISLADYVKELNRAFEDGRMENYRIPGTRPENSQLLELPDRELLMPYTNVNYRYTRIATRFESGRLGLKEARELMNRIRAHAKFPPYATARLTGSSLLFINMDSYLVNGQIKSFGIILVILCVVMVGVFRSLRLGLIAMIPNILPILTALALMGWLEIPLDGFTVMIASIAIGIGVDDTIHYLTHLKRKLKSGMDLEAAETETMCEIGSPLVYTSIILMLGFGVFCLSDFIGTRNFGFLTAITMVTALVGDLLLLSACLLIFRFAGRQLASK